MQVSVISLQFFVNGRKDQTNNRHGQRSNSTSSSLTPQQKTAICDPNNTQQSTEGNLSL
ncbi:MAG TPA: hypothetical protein VJ729_16750 [Nitrososphaeraceae archaeon]|nr:hypothetical protein [Nitrososphaeraceae archaeon]